MIAADVLEGRSPWSCETEDCLAWLAALPEQSVDLVMFSPPYERCRTYLENGVDLKIARDTEGWCAWMVQVIKACLRVCKGLVVCVCEGQTKNFRYSCGPLLLAADLHRAGVCLRKPPIFRRVGIPGSGGAKRQHEANGGSADWWRNDYEFCLCATNGGKLPWADALAVGHPPKWAPGGEMSHRLTDGSRVNQWGHPVRADGDKGKNDDGTELYRAKKGRRITRGHKDGDTPNEDAYDPPVLANPGNVVQQTYTAQQVADLLGEPADVLDLIVGGGVMGSKLSALNEAPYPEALVEPFVRCFCPEGGILLDCFSGSGTSLAVSVKWGRRAVGCDLRQSQVDLTTRRMSEAVDLFTQTGLET